MNWYVQILSLAVAALVTLFPGLDHLLGDGAPAKSETVSRTLAWGRPGQVLEVSDIRGSIHIVGEDRNDVAITAVRTVEREGPAGDPGPALDFREEGTTSLVCADAMRCGCSIHVTASDRTRDEDRTRVRVDFEVRVPRAATLDVCTVNGGSVRVEGTSGRFTLRNVNGSVALTGVRGAGRATTVNGSVDAVFTAAPEAPSEFRTVNGHVDVSLPASLSADLRLKTLNGGLYTDFDSTPLPTSTTSARRGGRTVWSSDRFAAVRVGNGGPELTFETLNGDVDVRKR